MMSKDKLIRLTKTLKPKRMIHYLDLHVWVHQMMPNNDPSEIEFVADTLWSFQIQGELDAWKDKHPEHEILA